MVWHLVADIGGTNARFAVLEGDRIARSQTFATSSGLDAALAKFVAPLGTPASAVMAFACPIRDGVAHLTNADEKLSVDQVERAIGGASVRFINDFEAAAWAVAEVSAQDVDALQGPPAPPDGTRLIVGPGTGLGVGILARHGAGWGVLPGEGGHISIAPRIADHVAIFERLVALWPQVAYVENGLCVEAEALLSGTGLPFLDAAIRSDTDLRSTAEVCAAEDPAAQAAVAMFRSYLGQLCGDLAITAMARGGVFVTGGVVQKNPWILDHDFLAAFNAHGRFGSLRQSMPVYRLKADDFGLIGAANAIRFSAQDNTTPN